MKHWIKEVKRLLAAVLVLAMVVECFPASVFAEKSDDFVDAAVQESSTTVIPQDTAIIAEVTEKRTEFSKEFVLTNGLHMAVVYPESVHYEKDGQWLDVDSTLKKTNQGYTNTADSWSVLLPQRLDGDTPVTVTIDGYTLSFKMSGALKAAEPPVVPDKPVVAAIENPAAEAAEAETAEAETAEAETAKAETVPEEEITQSVISQFQVEKSQASAAKIEKTDVSERKKQAQYPETVLDKLNSRVQYQNFYQNTNVVYDLSSGKLKESLVINRYDPTVRGYQYTLETGALVPVLTDSGEIQLFGADKNEPLLVMPAPYMIDNAGEYCYDVTVQLTGENGEYTLAYLLPQQWLAQEDRAFPVILDPVIRNKYSVTNVKDQTVAEKGSFSYNNDSLFVGHSSTYGVERVFLKFETLPALTASDVIVGAYVDMVVSGGSAASFPIEVHQVNGTWASDTITWKNKPAYNSNVEDYAVVAQSINTRYQWNITNIAQQWYQSSNTGMMFKATDDIESSTQHINRFFYPSDYGTEGKSPGLTIMFRNNNGLEGYWDYTSSSAGRAGTGYVNNFTGNLVWTHSDIGFSGYRMPVSISHVYNLNDITSSTAGGNNSAASGGNKFSMGIGWRTNLNQLVYEWSKDRNYYIWEDSDGTDHYFYKESEGVYKDEDGLELTLTTGGTGDQKYCITEKYGAKSYFDSTGRLSKIQNNQNLKSHIQIVYYGNSWLIDYVTDGAGRKYDFSYATIPETKLNYIAYMGTGSSEICRVSFGYDSSNHLTSITYKDGKKSTYTYNDKNLLTSAQDVDGYKLAYTYNTVSATWQPYRVLSVSESDGTTLGGQLSFAYAHNQTTITDHNITDQNKNKTILQFNDFGNLICTQDGEGRAVFSQYTFNTDDEKDSNTNATKKGNQLRAQSKLQYTTNNLFLHSSMSDISEWTVMGSATCRRNTERYFINDYDLLVNPSQPEAGVRSKNYTLAPGKSLTFSCYVYCSTCGVYLTAHSGEDEVRSETQPVKAGWFRLQVTYTNTTSVNRSVYFSARATDARVFQLDCPQLEYATTASRYNLIQNSDFSGGLSGWQTTPLSGGDGITTASPSAAPQLDGSVLKLTGSPSSYQIVWQSVKVSGKAGDYFTLCGWAKGNSAPLSDGRTFAMRALVYYTDGTTGTFLVSFNPDSDQWQYAATGILAEKDYNEISVSLRYEKNVNTVYFDGIQLYKDGYGDLIKYDSDGNVVSVRNSDSKVTTYEYQQNNLTKEILPTGETLTYTYDNYHNVKTATTKEGLVYSFTYDTCGNNTSVSITKNGVTMTSTAGYANDGNRLVSTTDARGNVTIYSYNANTGVLEWVKYPEDTDATRTEYTYDTMYRLAKAACTTDTGADMEVSYTYNGKDQLTAVSTPTTTYNFTYGAFSLRSSVKIGNRTLASYSYTNDRNFYLSALDYGNGDKVQYTYDSMGRVTTATYEDGETVKYTYDNSGTLATVADSASGTSTTYGYDFIGRLSSYEEKNADTEMSMLFQYDSESGLITYVRDTYNGHARAQRYEYDSDNRLTSYQHGRGRREYTYDGFNRVSSYSTKFLAKDESILNVLNTSFTFVSPSANTTGNQVASIRQKSSGFDTTYSYTYDGNGNILSVSDGTNTTSYVYDSANQLIRENNQEGGFTRTWTYDNAGNILSRNTYAYTTGELGAATDTVIYTYGDSSWGDLLTAYNGNAITYDAIGNPLSDGTWNYTWQHGRQLASMTDGETSWTYTYNADGLRTKRTDGTNTYTYAYYGGVLRFMERNGVPYYFTTAPDGTPMGIVENETAYYYVTNLQGDVVGIVEKTTGQMVVTYTYDAWGNVLSITGSKADTLGVVNPIRYRGYVYDQETGLYYLQSRYYNPETGRFLNADGLVSTGQGLLGNNMFVYCGNNPVNSTDPTGCSFVTLIGDVLNAVKAICEYLKSAIISATSFVTSEQLIAMGFKNVTSKSTRDLNRTLMTNNITSKVEITHFLAQCAFETNWGTWLTELGSEAYFEGNGYGYKYRGAGYIHLTWDYNYKAFSEAMGDPEIYNQGADYVAANYAWSASGWWWTNNNMNRRIANGATMAEITKVVNGSAASAPKRQYCYDIIWGIW